MMIFLVKFVFLSCTVFALIVDGVKNFNNKNQQPFKIPSPVRQTHGARRCQAMEFSQASNSMLNASDVLNATILANSSGNASATRKVLSLANGLCADDCRLGVQGVDCTSDSSVVCYVCPTDFVGRRKELLLGSDRSSKTPDSRPLQRLVAIRATPTQGCDTNTLCEGINGVGEGGGGIISNSGFVFFCLAGLDDITLLKRCTTGLQKYFCGSLPTSDYTSCLKDNSKQCSNVFDLNPQAERWIYRTLNIDQQCQRCADSLVAGRRQFLMDWQRERTSSSVLVTNTFTATKEKDTVDLIGKIYNDRKEENDEKNQKKKTMHEKQTDKNKSSLPLDEKVKQAEHNLGKAYEKCTREQYKHNDKDSVKAARQCRAFRTNVLSVDKLFGTP